MVTPTRAILVIDQWIGYTMATTAPPKPIEEITAEAEKETETKNKTETQTQAETENKNRHNLEPEQKNLSAPFHTNPPL